MEGYEGHHVEFQFITFWRYRLSKKPKLSVVLIFFNHCSWFEIVETEKVGLAILRIVRIISKSHEECPTIPVFNL